MQANNNKAKYFFKSIPWSPFLIFIFMGASVTLFLSSATLQFHQKNWPISTYSWIATSSQITTIIGSFALSITAVYITNRYIMASLYLFMIIFTALLFIFQDVPLMWIVYGGIRGFIFSHCYHILRIWLLEKSSKENYAKFNILSYLGLCIGNLIGPFTISKWGIGNTTLLLLLVSYLLCILVLVSTKLTVSKSPVKVFNPIKAIDYFKRLPQLWIICFVLGVTEVTYEFIGMFGLGLGFNETQSLLLINVLLSGAICLGYLLASIMDKFRDGYKFVKWTTLIVIIILISIIAIPAPYLMLVIAFFIIGGISSLLAESGNVLMTRFYDKDERNNGFILVNLFTMFGQITCTQTMGLTMSISTTLGFIGTSVAFMLVAFLASTSARAKLSKYS